jgi:acyl dehydratase
MTTSTRTITAFLDGVDSKDISNPIHSTEVAAEYGFKAALVGGVTVYGWTVPAILGALGEGWLDDGWVDVNFRRPVYPGDEMTATVAPSDDGRFTLAMTNGAGERCLVGEVGRGMAPWLAELHLRRRRAAEARPASIPYLTIENAPVGQDLRPMAVPFSREDATAYALEKQADTSALWTGEQARIHPGWIASKMTPLLHHSFDYAPAIHTRSQIQHLAPAYPGQTLTFAGRFVDAFERKGHHYAVIDGVMLSEDGRELARLRHTTIFRVAKASPES